MTRRERHDDLFCPPISLTSARMRLPACPRKHEMERETVLIWRAHPSSHLHHVLVAGKQEGAAQPPDSATSQNQERWLRPAQSSRASHVTDGGNAAERARFGRPPANDGAARTDGHPPLRWTVTTVRAHTQARRSMVRGGDNTACRSTSFEAS